MLLTGTFFRSLDDKQRFAIPKRVRDMLGDPTPMAIFLAPGTDGSLALYTEEVFSQLAGQLDQRSPTGGEIRAFSRLFFAQTERVDLDRQGRVRIPPELAQLAGISKEIVMIGVRDHLELWDRQRWDEYLASKQASYDELAEGAFGREHDSPADAPSLPTQPR